MAGLAIITEACIDVKDRACVDVCPVQCIYEYDPAKNVLFSEEEAGSGTIENTPRPEPRQRSPCSATASSTSTSRSARRALPATSPTCARSERSTPRSTCPTARRTPSTTPPIRTRVTTTRSSSSSAATSSLTRRRRRRSLSAAGQLEGARSAGTGPHSPRFSEARRRATSSPSSSAVPGVPVASRASQTRFSFRVRPCFFAWPDGFDFCAIGGQGRGVRRAEPVPHPPFNPCVRFPAHGSSDGLLDMVTPPSGSG